VERPGQEKKLRIRTHHLSLISFFFNILDWSKTTALRQQHVGPGFKRKRK
jgi:hypothetical protein